MINWHSLHYFNTRLDMNKIFKEEERLLSQRIRLIETEKLSP